MASTCFANIERQLPFALFREAWKDHPSAFVAFFTGLASDDDSALQRNPWNLTVTRRRQQVDAKGKNIPGAFWYSPAVAISASAASVMPGLLETVIGHAVDFASGSEAAPEITVGRHYGPWQVLGRDFPDRLVADARRTEGFFTWLGMSLAEV